MYYTLTFHKLKYELKLTGKDLRVNILFPFYKYAKECYNVIFFNSEIYFKHEKRRMKVLANSIAGLTSRCLGL